MPNTADIDELLRHSAWMKRLATSLARDSAQAEDLVQETWVAALQQPPRSGPTVRSWLGQVLRNSQRERIRRGSRADQRAIQLAEEAAPLPSVENLVGTAEIGRILAQKVLQLDDPYRSTLLQVFYEGLSPTEIAERTGAPAGTVRWRLKEGLDRIRMQLDRDHQGDRGAWMALLAPVVTRPGIPTAAPSTLTGGLAMKVGLASLGAAAIAVAAFSHTTPTQAEPPTPREATAPPPTASSPANPATPALAKRSDATRAPREVLLAQIQRAIHPSAPTPRDVPTPTLSPAYIRAQIHELAPLLRECYENALQTQPTLQGKLVVDFTIVGDPSVGGLVGQSTIASADPTLSNPGFQECVQETMYGARFVPPPAGGEVKVTYPFTFASSNQASSATGN